MQKNPHFDENRVIWKDEYSGQYATPETGYSEQFDLQWNLALKNLDGYYETPGASVEDKYIDDRVYEWTGQYPGDTSNYDASSGSRPMDHTVDPALIKDKKCADFGCGIGRWTRTIQRLGAASVLSADMSESALKSVSRFNDNVMKASVMTLDEDHPELKEQFDFVNFWGVAMCTHDPQKAFMNIAATVKPGGAMFLMVYAPEGLHGTDLTNRQRTKFNNLKTVEERLAYVDEVHNRKWDGAYSLKDNILNATRNLRGLDKGSKVGVLDLLEPFYNWVIPLDVIDGWMKKAGFESYTVMNEHEAPKAAFHVLGIKAGA